MKKNYDKSETQPRYVPALTEVDAELKKELSLAFIEAVADDGIKARSETVRQMLGVSAKRPIEALEAVGLAAIIDVADYMNRSGTDTICKHMRNGPRKFCIRFLGPAYKNFSVEAQEHCSDTLVYRLSLGRMHRMTELLTKLASAISSLSASVSDDASGGAGTGKHNKTKKRK